MKIKITIIFWFSFVFNLFAGSFGFLGDTIPLEKSSVINKVSNYSFYKEKFDINNPEHLRIMNEPTQDELNAFAANLEAAGKDEQLNLQLNDLLNHAILIYDNAINSASLKNERDFFDVRNKLLQILKNGNQISATSFDPVNGFAGGPINSCLSDHPAIKLHKRVFEMIHNIKTKVFGVTIKNRNESSGTLSANIQSMYTTSNFLTSVNTIINGDPDMPQDLVASQVRFETVASSVPSWMSDPSNPLANMVDLRNELETNGMRGGINADVFHFVAKSNILGTGTSVNEFGVIGGCTDDIPNVGVHVGSSSNLPSLQTVAHELTHGIAEVNHTNTPDDIANNEIMRPVVNTISNYRNQTFTIDPFWALVNQSEDCLNAAPPLPVALTTFNAIVENCNSCPLGQAVKLLWRTESETNNAGFEIELSRDGIHFSSIGFVPSLSSNSVSSLSYDFGVLSLAQGGTYYFRLKILAKDGSLPTFSDINSVYLVDHAAIPVLLQNPCYANASFGISNLFVGDKVSIYCYNGTLLQEYSIDLDAIDPLSFFAPAQPGLFIVKVARLDAIYSFKLSVIK